MQNWNFIIKQLNLPESMYGFNNLMNLIGDSNSTVVLCLEDLTTKIEVLLFEAIDFTKSDNLIMLNDFRDFSHTKRWEILFEYDAITYAVYKQVRDLIIVFDRQTTITTRTLVIAINRLKYVIDAIADKKLFSNSREGLSTDDIATTSSNKGSYDLFPSLEDIPLPIKMNTRVLESFWDIFIVHFDLDNHKFSYELIKTMVRYNPDGALKKMNILFRFLGVARLNYLAESKSMVIGEPFGTPERLAHLSTEVMWEKIYNDYDLPIEEYEMAKKVSKVLKHVQVPKNIVADVFASFEQLVTKLFFVVKEQQGKKKVSHSVRPVVSMKEMRPPEVSKAVREIEERRERAILSTTSNAEIAASVHTPDKMVERVVEITSATNQTDDSKKQPSKYGSLFLQKIKGLQKSSNETVVNANELGNFQSYMHVERKIERDTVAKLEEMQASSTPQLLLLLGSVGDGKSHLLAYLKATKPNLFNNVYIHNDATESYERTKPAEATLERILSPFEDGFVPKQHIVVAINYGKLHNFYLLQKEKGQFQLFTSYIDSLNIFNKTKSDKKADAFESFHTVDFSKEKYYSISEKGVYSSFFSKILEKITAPEGVNEIYQAWLQDKSNNKWTMALSRRVTYMPLTTISL